MDKILTISVAAYNVEPYISDLLDSLVQCEKVDSLEILVIDDGGTDNTLNIANEYAAKYPGSVFAVHKENGGYGSVVNKSISMATGKFFKQLDGDDWFWTENLDAFIEVLERTEADIVFTQIVHYFEKDGHTEIRDVCEEIEEGLHDFNDVFFQNNIRMHAATIRTKILRDAGVKLTEHCFYSDIELIYQPLRKMRNFYAHHAPLYIYRLGSEGQSMSITGMRKNYQDHEKIFWNIMELYRKIPEDELAKRSLLMARLKFEAATHFKFCAVLTPLRKGYEEIRRFGNKLLREAPDIYKGTMRYSKFFHLMVTTHYILFPVLSRYEIRERERR